MEANGIFGISFFFKNVPSFEYEITFYLLNRNKNKVLHAGKKCNFLLSIVKV
jgi:hypothetical protein